MQPSTLQPNAQGRCLPVTRPSMIRRFFAQRCQPKTKRKRSDPTGLLPHTGVDVCGWLRSMETLWTVLRLTSSQYFWSEARGDCLVLFHVKDILRAANEGAPTIHTTLHSLMAKEDAEISSIVQHMSAARVWPLHTLRFSAGGSPFRIFFPESWPSKANNACLEIINSATEALWRRTFLNAQRKLNFEKVSSYEHARKIGTGSSCVVYAAERGVDGYEVAIKAMNKAGMFEDNYCMRNAIRERMILERVRGLPFVIQMTSAFQDNDNLFFGLEFCVGDLKEVVQQEALGLSRWAAKRVAAELVIAMDKIHKAGVIHRDLKHENIMVTYDGHVRLADFGLSHLFDPDDDDTEWAHSFCGTPDFVAPEVIGGQAYGREADLWSYGALLYELLVGRAPFHDSDCKVIFGRVQQGLKPLYPADMSSEEVDLISRLLCVDSEERLTVGEVKRHAWFADIDWELLEAAPSGSGPLLHSAAVIEACNKRGTRGRESNLEWLFPDSKDVRRDNFVPGFQYARHVSENGLG